MRKNILAQAKRHCQYGFRLFISTGICTPNVQKLVKSIFIVWFLDILPLFVYFKGKKTGVLYQHKIFIQKGGSYI